MFVRWLSNIPLPQSIELGGDSCPLHNLVEKGRSQRNSLSQVRAPCDTERQAVRVNNERVLKPRTSSRYNFFVRALLRRNEGFTVSRVVTKTLELDAVRIAGLEHITWPPIITK